MTSNQIEAKKAKIEEGKLQETIRSNKAKENIDLAKLNETIRNNNLINEVNITKNEIQRLYNDQLNHRQLLDMKSKLDLAYDQLNETAHANDIKVDIEKYKGELDMKINEAKNDASIRVALINAFGRAAGTIGKIFMPSVFTKGTNINSLGYDKDLTIGLLTGSVTNLGAFDDPRLRAGTGASDDDIREAEKKYSDKVESNNPYYDYEKQIQWYENELRKEREKNKHVGPILNERSRSNYYIRNRYNELDEIPSDTSNSNGPGAWLSVPSINNSNSNSYIDKSENPVKSGEIQSSKHGTTSGGTDYHVSGGHISSGIIYA